MVITLEKFNTFKFTECHVNVMHLLSVMKYKTGTACIITAMTVDISMLFNNEVLG